MNINFTYLKYFYDAVKLGGVSGSAKANYVTQSAISQGITKLEKSLGTLLVAHHPNRFRLTPEGEIAFERAAEILRKITEFKDELNVQAIGSLEFACTYSFAVSNIPRYLQRFKQAYPTTEINFYLGKNSDIKQMLKKGAIDFGIGPDEGDLEDYEKHDLHQGFFGLYVSSTVKENSNLDFILAEGECKDSAFFRQTYCKHYGRMPTVALEVNSWEVIANLSIEGLGIGYFPDYIALGKKEMLKKYELNLPCFPYSIKAFYPRGMKLRKSSEIFISYFQAE
jgi:DNA-binding transcriptional LysR family regulator